MAVDFGKVLNEMRVAAQAAAGVHWKDIRGFLEQELAIAQREAAAIALEVAAGTKLPEQATIELESIIESVRDVQLAVQVASKAAAQDAINAALDVLRAAVNSAAGIALL